MATVVSMTIMGALISAVHASGSMFVMCDGSVQMFSYNIDPQIFWKLSNRRDGLDVQLP